MSNLDEYWIISVPNENATKQAYEKLSETVKTIATINKLNIPNLKVGTLDQLFGLSDDLTKIDAFVER